MKKIILASGSTGRKGLLVQIGLKFEVDPSNYKEDMTLQMPPDKLAEYLSLGKAKMWHKGIKIPLLLRQILFASLVKKLSANREQKKMPKLCCKN